MAVILVNTNIQLPADMYWENEFSWSPVTLKTDRSVMGSLIIQVGKKTGGRQITLKSGDEVAWLQRSELEALKTLQRSLPTPIFPLVFADGRAYNVMFDESSGPAIVADAKQPGKIPAPSDYFAATLLFIEV